MSDSPHVKMYLKAKDSSEALPTEANQRISNALNELGEAISKIQTAEHTLITAEESLPGHSVAFHQAKHGIGVAAAAVSSMESAEKSLGDAFTADV